MADFSENLKMLRLQAKEKQTELAGALGVTSRTIAFYESGERRPTFEGLCFLADYFGVSIDYLVGRCDNPQSHKR